MKRKRAKQNIFKFAFLAVLLSFLAPVCASVYTDSTGKTIIEGSSVQIPDGDLVITTGDLVVSGSFTASSFTANGSSITNIDPGNVSSGTLGVTYGGTGVTSSTGTGSVVLSASPTFTGTVTAGTFSGTHTGSGAGLTNLSSSSGFSDTGSLITLDNDSYNVSIGNSSETSKLVVENDVALFRVVGETASGLTASTESTDINIDLARNVEFNSGTIVNQRAMKIQGPTLAFNAASTVTDAATLEIGGAPLAGSNATITNPRALMIAENSSSTGPLFTIRQLGSGDASMLVESGSTSYSIGVDNSDGDKFKISRSATLGTNDNFVMTTTGNIGFNTNNPASALEIEGASTTPLIRLGATSSLDTAMEFEVGASNDQTVMIGLDNDDSDKFKISDTDTTLGTNDRLVITTAGNVGLQESSPSELLDITGDLNLDSGSVIMSASPNPTNDYFLGPSATNGITFDASQGQVFSSEGDQYFNIDSDNDGSGHYFVWQQNINVTTAGTELMRLEDSGELGIGTPSPAQELHVVGNIKMVDGDQSTGRVMATDANGVASWSSSGNGLTGTLTCSGTNSVTYNDHCYKLFGVTGTTYNMPNAASLCLAWGGYLAQITSSGEQTSLNTLRGSNDTYIGATDLANANDYRWAVDHTDASKATAPYQNWHSSEPNNGGERCVVMAQGYSGQWADVNCGNGYTFICERENPAPPTADGCDATVDATQEFDNDMWGCATLNTTSVTYANRETLCKTGYSACTKAEYESGNPQVGVSAKYVPSHNYWVNEGLQYGGSGAGNCYVVTSGGGDCGATPMRVCTANGVDTSYSSSCNWYGCDTDSVSASENWYYGGCSGNTYAGTLCCPD